MTDARSNIVKVANWGPPNHGRFTYSEGADRMADVAHPFAAKITCDCSAWVTYCYAWAGAPDPNGLKFDGEGYTGSELSHDQHIALFRKNAQGVNVEEVLPGDLIVFGPGTGLHVAIVVKATADSILVSHGKQGDPSFIKVSDDGREPQTYLRCNTTQIRPPAPFPAPPKPKPIPKPVPKPVPTNSPTAAQLKAQGLVLLMNPAQAATALKNGYSLHKWNGFAFCAPSDSKARGNAEYSDVGFQHPHSAPRPVSPPTPKA